MAFTVPTFEEIRDAYLQALVNQRPDAPIGKDSDNFVRASATAAVLESLYAHQAWGYRQAFPDLADSDFMEKEANERGLTRKAAAVAEGLVRFTGTAGTNVPAGQQVFTAQGIYVQTLTAALIGLGGTVDIAAAALLPGAGSNLAANTAGTLSAPPANIAGDALILSMTGGADVEADADLLQRLLLDMSEEAQGGNAVDYKRWALEVPGITRAYVFDTRRGAGTVDVVPMTDDGLPTPDQVTAVQVIVDERRPVGMRSAFGAFALAPTPVYEDVAATLTLAPGFALLDLQPQLESAVDSVFRSLGPGDTLVRAKIIAALMNITGVVDVALVSPAANVTCTVSPVQLEIILRASLTLS